MPAMKWTDEAIDYQLSAISAMRRDNKPFDAVTLQLEAALLELKRVRTWIKLIGGEAYLWQCVLDGDPVPSGEEENNAT